MSSESTSFLQVPVGPSLAAIVALAYRAGRKPVLVEGPSGIGKSECIAALADGLGIETRVLDLSLLEPPDLIGLPRVDEHGRTRYAPPAILPMDGAGMLVLEELNRADRAIQQPALQLLTFRALHDYRLPEAWQVIAAVNPSDGNYAVSELDPALRDRFLVVNTYAERTVWLEWARRSGIHPGVVMIAERHDDVFAQVSPRRWVYVSDILHACDRAPVHEAVLRHALAGYLPLAWLQTLLALRAHWESTPVMRALDVLTLFDQDTHAQALLASAKQHGRTDVLERLTHDVRALLEGPSVAVLIDHEQCRLAAFERLLEFLPGDCVDALQEAFGNNPTLARLLDVKPEDVMTGYTGTYAHRTMVKWARSRNTRHRMWTYATAVVRYVTQHPERATLRNDRRVRMGLGRMLAQLDERTADRLRNALKRDGIVPLTTFASQQPVTRAEAAR